MKKVRYIPEDLVRGICVLCENYDSFIHCESCRYQPLGDGAFDYWTFKDTNAIVEIALETEVGAESQPDLPFDM